MTGRAGGYRLVWRSTDKPLPTHWDATIHRFASGHKSAASALREVLDDLHDTHALRVAEYSAAQSKKKPPGIEQDRFRLVGAAMERGEFIPLSEASWLFSVIERIGAGMTAKEALERKESAGRPRALASSQAEKRNREKIILCAVEEARAAGHPLSWPRKGAARRPSSAIPAGEIAAKNCGVGVGTVHRVWKSRKKIRGQI